MWGNVIYTNGTEKRMFFWSIEAIKHMLSSDKVWDIEDFSLL